MSDKDLIADIVSAYNNHLVCLSAWEEEFVESISEKEVLSDKQRAIAKRIYEKIEA